MREIAVPVQVARTPRRATRKGGRLEEFCEVPGGVEAVVDVREGKVGLVHVAHHDEGRGGGGSALEDAEVGFAECAFFVFICLISGDVEVREGTMVERRD